MKRLLLLLLPMLLVSCDVVSRVRRSVTQTSDQKRNEEFRKVYDKQLELEQQRVKQTAEQLAIEKEVWRKYAEDTKRNEQETKEEEKRNEQRSEEEDARAERYEAVLKKWEEQATRFDAILDRWEKIEPLQPSN
jgi:septal ring factor EnvC (AmiA/AmiB activator)